MLISLFEFSGFGGFINFFLGMMTGVVAFLAFLTFFTFRGKNINLDQGTLSFQDFSLTSFTCSKILVLHVFVIVACYTL